ncbi:hypothetical protein [Labrys neptuniae]
MSVEHTPTPWRVEEGTTLIWGNCTVYEDGTPDHLGVPIVQCRQSCDWNARLTTDVASANALFLVTAVNAYEPDQARIAELRQALEAIGAPDEPSLVVMSDPAIRGWAYAAARIAREILEEDSARAALEKCDD